MRNNHSVKVNTLYILQAIFKHSDKDHHLSTRKIADLIEPYGQKCTIRLLPDTLSALREFGKALKTNGVTTERTFWLDSRPFPEDIVDKYIFAISTNPFVTQKQATELLEELKPFVTVYKEPYLRSLLSDCENYKDKLDDIYQTYNVIQRAIIEGKRVICQHRYTKYNKKTMCGETCETFPIAITPTALINKNDRIYIVGYNLGKNRPISLDIAEIVNIKIAVDYKSYNHQDALDAMVDVDPDDIIPKTNEEVIYTGPVAFMCKEKSINLINKHFGNQYGKVFMKQLHRNRYIYSVENATITSETLHWMIQLPQNSVAVYGPPAAKEAIRKHLDKISKSIVVDG